MTPRGGLVVLALLVPAGPLPAQRASYEGSLSAATGRYIFTERTTSAALTTGVSVTLGSLTVRASVPIWWQNSVLVSGSAGGPIPSGGGGARSREVSDSGAARRRRGGGTGMSVAMARGSGPGPIDIPTEGEFRTALGDPLASLSFRVTEGRLATFSLGLGAKIPVADTGGFGTGRWDVGASASLSLTAAPRTVVGLDLSYWHLGDLATLDFRDPVAAGVGISRLFGSGWGAMLTGSLSTTALAGFAGPASVGGGVTRFGRRSAWGVNLAVGLSETSPDLSGGLTWRIGL
jgi:hypothetical protein